MQEETLYSWLHISDLHVFDSSETALIQEEFSTLAKHFHPDFLVVTGDFRHKAHAGSDFTKALGYLNAIVKAFGLEKKHVYLVPGNHDVNNYDFREECISKIREGLKDDSDSYTKYGHGKMGDLYQGFSDYIEFVHKFYGDELNDDDPRLRSPADVILCTWDDKVNLVLVNTALISTGESSLAQICDIHSFCNLQIENNLPTLVLGHHGLHRMHDSHKGKMEQKLNYLKACAYLCGDSHKLDRQKIHSVDHTTFIPQYTCGKSAPETRDTYSDLCAIGYTCKTDGKAYVQVYKYEKNTTGNGAMAFHDTPDFKTGLQQNCFKMQNPVPFPPCTKAEEKREQKEPTAINYHSSYNNDWPTFGREKEIKDITNLLSHGDMGKLIWVSGVAGIGKSDLCKAAARKMIGDYPGWDMPYISARDVKGYVPLIGALTKALGISLPEQQDLWYDSILEELRRRKTQWKLSPLPTLYFDNFEDVKENLGEVYGLLFAIRDLGYHLLFSSQSNPNDPAITDIPVKPLPFEGKTDISNEEFLQLESARLFCRLWKKTPEDEEWKAFRTLIRELQGHPLAIVLSANMARNSVMGLSEVVKGWPTASKQAKSPKDKHSSLEKALRLAWNSFRGKEKEAATLYWALQYYSVLPIPDALLLYLTKACPEEKVKLGINALYRYNLIYGDRKALTMLRPIQQQLPELLKKKGRLDPKNGVLKNALCIWAKSLTALLEDTEARGTEQYSKALELVLPLMPQVLHILEKLSQNSQHDSRLLDLADTARNYYQYYVDSVNTLLRLSGKPIANRYPRFRAFLFERAGMLQSRLGKPEEAGRLYDAAEALYRKGKSDLGLANTLLDKGKLEFRLGKPEEAGRLYDTAEALYRKEKDDLGLANTLRSKGELEFRLGKSEEAGRLYDAAEELYQKIKFDLGLANTLLLKGELEFRLGKPEEAGRLYDEAEELYRKEKSDLSLANTLRYRGDLAVQQGQFLYARECFDKAEPLYRKDPCAFRSAELLLSYSALFLRMGGTESAQEKAQKALELSKRIRYAYGITEAEKLLQEIEHRTST